MCDLVHGGEVVSLQLDVDGTVDLEAVEDAFARAAALHASVVGLAIPAGYTVDTVRV